MPNATYTPLDEATLDMLRWFFYRTGIQPSAVEGDVLRTIFEAVGFEIEDLTARFDQELERAVPEAAFRAFGLPRETAVAAVTTLRFSRSSAAPEPYLIPAGTRAQTPSGVRFETTSDATIPLNETFVDVPARAVEPGSAGNVPAGTVTELVDLIPGVEQVTNPQPAVGGRDEEALEDQIARFARFFTGLQKGTLQSLEAAALEATSPAGERVTQVLARDITRDPSLPPAVVRLYVDNGSASVTPEMVDYLRTALDAGRPAGVSLEVIAAAPKYVDIRFQVDGSDEALAACYEAARQHVRDLQIGQKLSRENLIAALTVAHPDVREITLIEPAADVPVAPGERAVVGVLEGSTS
ncbi:baseplate J/gp47 family protein [Oceanithermus sp.]|uniref:baseplate J/gp47 family protein n=1 Tax=Oceanithermus sp. TaxID=2268145 RepID=UPI002580B5FE|nr:baseplate J/gp47 family protein [Oceanithermus sp.]